MALIQSTAIPSGATDYELEQSLKFNDDNDAKLSFTPATNGTSQTTFTASFWFKRGVLSHSQWLFDISNTTIYFDGNDCLAGNLRGTVSGNYFWTTNAKFRDPSAWYHIVAAWDSSQSTDTNRFKLYVNGELQTFSSISYMPQDRTMKDTTTHYIGYEGSGYSADGYFAEFHFIDGQQLTPADFGETGDYGEWKPIEYSGTYGTNGFYLPFKQDYTVEGFSAVTYKGTGVDETYIGGVGFQSDLTWIARRGNAENHIWIDSVRGTNKRLLSNLADAEATDDNIITGFTTDGFTIGTDAGTNAVDTYVAWNWDMGGSNASNTDGGITSTVRANTTYGQSIVSYTGTGSASSVGHGLDSAPDMVILKRTNAAEEWSVYHAGINPGWTVYLNGTAGEADDSNNETFGNLPSSITSTTFGVGTHARANASGSTYVAYCFHDVTGYSKFSKYAGSGNSGNTVTTGFLPAMVIIKDHEHSGESWYIFDSTRNPSNPVILGLYANANNAEEDMSGGNNRHIQFDANGFTVLGTDSSVNASGHSYIYMAFADKREYAYWLDQSGNNNDWTSNNLTESDISVDSPTNNFATWNPLDKSSSQTLSEGNLVSDSTVDSAWKGVRGTFGISSGKWYWEYLKTNTYLHSTVGIAIADAELDVSTALSGITDWWMYSSYNGAKIGNGSETSYGATWQAVGDVVGIALDMDNGTLTFYKNGVSQGQAFNSGLSGKTVYPYRLAYNSADLTVANFGQDSSFAGNKTAQGNQDGNDIGDFYYTPPTGFLALCTSNLPDVAVVPSEHFNTVAYSGNDADDRSISVGFQPDWVWLKGRSNATNHYLYDVLRGANYQLLTNDTGAESNTADRMQAFESNGFQLGTSNEVNGSGRTYVAWNWKANGSGSSNTDGDIDSTISANTDAKFSVVSYTGVGGEPKTVAHGLGVSPEMVIIKKRNNAGSWIVWHKDLADNYAFEGLDTTGAAVSGGSPISKYVDAVSSTLVTLGDASENNNSGDTYIMYCWASVDGYSAVGSYIGNGNADGPFVYTGFRPAFVLTKVTNAADDWSIADSSRSPDNVAGESLRPNSSSAEDSAADIDILSNGFKVRQADSHRINYDGDTFIYIAFAETPFKNSNAR